MTKKIIEKKPSLSLKPAKITGMTIGLMAGTMLMGAGLASAGWYFSDQVKLTLAEPATINSIGSGDIAACSSSQHESRRQFYQKVRDSNGNIYEHTIVRICKQSNLPISEGYQWTIESNVLTPEAQAKKKFDDWMQAFIRKAKANKEERESKKEKQEQAKAKDKSDYNKAGNQEKRDANMDKLREKTGSGR